MRKLGKRQSAIKTTQYETDFYCEKRMDRNIHTHIHTYIPLKKKITRKKRKR